MSIFYISKLPLIMQMSSSEFSIQRRFSVLVYNKNVQLVWLAHSLKCSVYQSVKMFSLPVFNLSVIQLMCRKNVSVMFSLLGRAIAVAV
jgi:hypothetical protein